MSQHLRTDPGSRWRRKVAGVPVFGWVILSSLTAAAAVAFFVLLGVSGSLTAGDGIDVRYLNDLPPGATVTAGSPTCGVSYVSATEIAITASNVSPGDACKFASLVENTGPATAYLAGFALDSADFSDGEVTAQVTTCGQKVANGSSDWAEVTITFGGVTPGQSFSFDPSLDGFDWQSSNPGSCT